MADKIDGLASIDGPARISLFSVVTSIQGPRMKKLAVLALIALEILVCSCGTSTKTTTQPTTSAGGKWQAVMSGGVAQTGALDFVTAFTVGSGGGALDITAFSFLTTGSCFSTTVTENGSATLVTDSSNAVTGTLNYSVSGADLGSTLTLTGTTVTGTSNNGVLTGGVVTGTWSLSSSATGCITTGGTSGTFTMTQSST